MSYSQYIICGVFLVFVFYFGGYPDFVLFPIFAWEVSRDDSYEVHAREVSDSLKLRQASSILIKDYTGSRRVHGAFLFIAQ